MATQSEQLASAIAAITQLNQTFTAEVAQWQQQRTSMQSLLNQAVAAVPNLSKSYWVDALNGNDANQGTQAQPLATLAKAYDMASSLNAGRALINLKPGVYEWFSHSRNLHFDLQIFGEIEQSGQTIINAPENSTCIALYSASLYLRDVTIRRIGSGGSVHYPFALLHGGASLACGISALSGATSSVLNRFKYIGNVSTLVKAERGWGFFSFERSFAESINAVPQPLYEARNQLLVNTINSVLSNMTMPTITLGSTKAGVV